MYGTLMLDDVVRTLIGRVPESMQTSAPGWRVAHLPDLPYPGLVADPTTEAFGRVYSDLTEYEFAVVDAFENPTYLVEPVGLRTGRCGLAYVWPEPALPGVWTLATLDDGATRAYLERVAAWRERREGSRAR